MRDKEAAERATLVTQEKLQRYSNRQPHRLQDVWIQPALSAKRKVPGNLDAHYNGFRCAPSLASSVFMYEVTPSFTLVGTLVACAQTWRLLGACTSLRS